MGLGSDSNHNNLQESNGSSQESNASTYPSYCQVLRFKDSSGQTKEMVFPKALDLDRPKRPRTTFSESQLHQLELEFNRCQYLVGSERTRLARTLGLSETQIKVWFQNRRTKCKRGRPDGNSDVVNEGTEVSLPKYASLMPVLPLSHPLSFYHPYQQSLVHNKITSRITM